MANMGTCKTTAFQDARFLRLLAQRDVAAYERLYDEMAPVVFGYLMKTAGNAELAELLLVETFYEAWTRMSAFTGDRSALQVWLIGIAHSRLRNHVPVRDASFRAA